MHPVLAWFVALEVPVLFAFASSVLLLRHKPPAHWLPKLLALAFPLLALGGIGLPLWALHTVLTAAR